MDSQSKIRWGRGRTPGAKGKKRKSPEGGGGGGGGGSGGGRLHTKESTEHTTLALNADDIDAVLAALPEMEYASNSSSNSDDIANQTTVVNQSTAVNMVPFLPETSSEPFAHQFAWVDFDPAIITILEARMPRNIFAAAGKLTQLSW